MKTNRFYKAAEKGYSFAAFGYDIRAAFLWFDLWVGFYYDRANKTVYFCPLPTICFRFRRTRKPLRVSIKFDHILPIEFVGKLSARFAAIKEEEMKKIGEQMKARILDTQGDYAERMNYKVFKPDDDPKKKPLVVAFSPDWAKGNMSAEAAERSKRLAIESQPREITLDPENDPNVLTSKKLQAMIERARYRPPIETTSRKLKPSISDRGFRTPPRNRKKRRERKDRRK